MFKLSQTIVALGVCLLLLSCSTARDRDSEDNLYSVLKFKDAETEDMFDDTYRSGNIYLDYSTVLSVDSIYKDINYRKRFLNEFSDVYYFDKSTRKQWAKKTVEEYQTTFEFLVFVFNGSNSKTRLGSPSSEWQVFLRDDEGDILRPLSIKKLTMKNREVVFLDKYFYAMDRWSEVFRIRFPKLDKAKAKSDSFQLIFSGIKGKTIMQWDQANVFYQSDKYLDF